MRTVGTGTTVVIVATVPLFATIFNAFVRRGVTKGEWFAVALGLSGIVLLNHGDPSPSSTFGSLAILCAAIFWAGGVHLVTRLPQPSDLLMSTALQIGLGGLIATVIALLLGEWLTHMSVGAGVSFLYYAHRLDGRVCRVQLSYPPYEHGCRNQLPVYESGRRGHTRRSHHAMDGDCDGHHSGVCRLALLVRYRARAGVNVIGV